MSVIERPSTLIVRLNGREMGSLVRTPDRTIAFAFNPAYVEDDRRPTLSTGMFDAFGQLRTRRYSGNPYAPAFFANLIAEGHLREYTAHRAGLARDDDFGLLWVTGSDLPGAVTLEDPHGRTLPPPLEGGPADPPPPQDVFRFALSGVQLKFSAVQEATGGLTIRTHGEGGNQIVKLPSAMFEGVPEGEYAMLQFARELGIPVPRMQLVPIDRIRGLPDEARALQGQALVVERFDRPAPGLKVHTEDFNQIFRQQPSQKYDNYGFAHIAKTIYQAIGNEALIEFIERLVFTIAIANNDMHLKNWSLIYPDGRHPQLAPAYDYVCTKAYLRHNETGLALANARFFSQVTLEQFERLADRADVPRREVRTAASRMVERVREGWAAVRGTMPENIAHIVGEQLATVPLFAPSAPAALPRVQEPALHEELE